MKETYIQKHEDTPAKKDNDYDLPCVQVVIRRV